MLFNVFFPMATKKSGADNARAKRSIDISLKNIRSSGNALLKGVQTSTDVSKRMRNAPRNVGVPASSSFNNLPSSTSASYNPRIDAARISLHAHQKRNEFESFGNSSITLDKDAHRENIGSRHLKRIYHNQFMQVIDASDILLEVLDARDPMSCRLSHFEKIIQSKYGSKKSIILVMNKVDLVPNEIVKVWQSYFEAEGVACIPFCTGKYSHRAKHYQTGSDTASGCIDAVFREIRQISKTDYGVHRSVTVGVIGFPNVGKSSVINALKRRSVLSVSAHAGSTKSTTSVDLKKSVKILDCPGIITAQTSGTSWKKSINNYVLINAVNVHDVENPVGVFEDIVYKVKMQTILDHFSLDLIPGESCTGLLERIGRGLGKILPGGVIDVDATAQAVLYQWSSGRIQFYTLPPDDAEGVQTYHAGVLSLEDPKDDEMSWSDE